MPTTRSGRAVAAAISVTESAEVFVARIASGRQIRSSSAKSSRFGAELLDDRLDDEVAAGEVVELGRQREPRDRGVARALLELALLDLAREEVADPVARALAELGASPRGRPSSKPASTQSCAIPAPIVAEPDDADAADLAAHSRSTTAAIAWPKPMHMHATP